MSESLMQVGSWAGLPQSLQMAVVGDIHGQWDDEDVSALRSLGIDLVLFVGDFGNEDLDLVQRIAQVPIPIAVVFGNHDSWYTATPWGRQKCPYDRHQTDRVQEQMAAVGANHVGYNRKDFPAWHLSVVGGRPFSWGGPDWKYADFYAERFGVGSLAESGDRITQAALQAPFETVIILNHNGPTGLGSIPEAPCGRDWQPIGGDYGDPDLADSIQRAKALGKTVPLVAFGHMHHTLRHTRARLRQRVVVDGDGTVYLNAACVPRVMHLPSGCYRNFSTVQLQQGRVTQVRSIWVTTDGAIASQEILLGQNESLTQTARLLSEYV